ncbi:alpha/beta hydrolase [Limnobacter humi]|uniref:Alpha/beta hydrolase n=1 Tax=Limnobacter humi TaxID=1778671 RepID=A0ABT1WFR8_9BURK|nr:alpha/beta hydrolase [Limnobacter humi]MCQ8895748.1 alpha/beta hydrolase [Limnobacter humi]
MRVCLLSGLLTGLLSLAGCAMVDVSSVSSKEFVALRRGDVLTTGELSNSTRSALQVLGLDENTCEAQAETCRNRLRTEPGLSDEQRMASLSELWLQEALRRETESRLTPGSGALKIHTMAAHLESARYAYAYLFFTTRGPTQRALEDRQAQVRDYYNFSTQQAAIGLFGLYQDELQDASQSEGLYQLALEDWTIRGSTVAMSLNAFSGLPKSLMTATELEFGGLRNQYRRDGLGAELVAAFGDRVVNATDANTPWNEMTFPVFTVLLKFEGNSLDEVLKTRNVEWLGYDPYRSKSTFMAGTEVPLAANFTAGYGLWLARSGFAQQSLLTLVGRGDALEKPRIYLMQPYDPKRKVLVMLHGLASSPEAWVNVANEVLGDAVLRENYQIWQVYYPTNLPLAFNNRAIRDALSETLKAFDPKGVNPASHDMVLLGHSMGGVIARLMVSDAGSTLWDGLLSEYAVTPDREQRLRSKLEPLLKFSAMPQVSRAIFVATPHRGTEFAENRFARFVSGIIRLPASVLSRVTEIAQLLVDPDSAAPAALTRPLNSINNLSNQDPFVNLAATLPISNRVKYHTIVGNDTPDLPLEDSNDGVVPYRSAHLEGAASELVIPSWHSVQERPQAIVEIRRILREHLAAHSMHARNGLN